MPCWIARIGGGASKMREMEHVAFTAEGKKTAALEIWEWWRTTHVEWHNQIGEGAEHTRGRFQRLVDLLESQPGLERVRVEPTS